MAQTTTILLNLVSAVITTVLTFNAWKNRDKVRWVTTFSFLMVALTIWSISYAMELAVLTLDAKIFWLKIRYAGILTVPFLWFIFAARYAGFQQWFSSTRNIVLLALIPLLTFILVQTDNHHQLLWREITLDLSGPFAVLAFTYGPWFWIHFVYAQFLVLGGTILIYQGMRKFHARYRRYALFMLAAPALPWVANAIYMFDLGPIPNVSWSATAFSVSCLFITIAVFREKLFNLIPVARQTIAHSMRDGLIVLDPDNRLIDINPAAIKILQMQEESVIGQAVTQLCSQKGNFLQLWQQAQQQQTPGMVDVLINGRYFDVTFSQVRDNWGAFQGQIISLRDVSEYKQAKETAVQQKRLFENLAQIAKVTSRNLSTQSLAHSIVEATTTLTNAESGSLILLDENQQIRHFLPAYPAHSNDIAFAQKVLREGLACWAIRHNRAALVPDIRLDERWITHPHQNNATRSVLVMPIIFQEKPLALLTLHHTHPAHFGASDLILIEAAADQIALAIRNAQSYETQRRIAIHQTIVYAVLNQVSQILDPLQVFRFAVDIIHEKTGWSGVAIILPNKQLTDFEVKAASGILATTESLVFPINVGISGRTFHNGTTSVVVDVRQDPNRFGNLEKVRSAVCAPIIFQKQKLGLLSVQETDVNAFQEEDVRLVEALADACALAIRNANLLQQTKKQLSEQTALREAITTITTHLDVPALLHNITQQLCSAIGTTSALIYRVKPASKPPHLLAHYATRQATGMERAIMQDGLPKGYPLPNQPDLAETTIIPTAHWAHSTKCVNLSKHGVKTILRIPLKAFSFPDTYAELWDSHGDRTLSAHDIELAETIARHATVALGNASLFQTVNTERERLNTIIQTSRSGIILMNADYHILAINKAALTFLNLGGAAATWTNQPLQTALAHFPDLKANLLNRAAAETETGGEFETNAQIFTWQKLPVNISEKNAGHILQLHNVTEERQIERLREDLTGMLIHDLRNPLSSVKMSVDMLPRLMTDQMTPKLQRIIDRINCSNDRAFNLVNEILIVQQLENGRLPIEYSLFSLQDVVADSVNTAVSRLETAQIRLTIDFPNPLPQVWADKKLIGRVLDNLLSNAIKFTEPGGQITLKAAIIENDLIHVSIQDTGAGIPAHIIDTLFQKFVAGDQENRGNGLGLAFCNMVLKQHQQQIWVADTSEHGSTFTFSLQAAAEHLP